VIEHLMENESLKNNMEGALNMIGAKWVIQLLLLLSVLLLILIRRAANMLSTLKVIREQFGGVEGYMIERCGLTKEEVEKIRSNLIVEEPALHQKLQYNL